MAETNGNSALNDEQFKQMCLTRKRLLEATLEMLKEESRTMAEQIRKDETQLLHINALLGLSLDVSSMPTDVAPESTAD